jgi:hypothetical protein
VAPRSLLADPGAKATLGHVRVDPALVRKALRVAAAWGGARQDDLDCATQAGSRDSCSSSHDTGAVASSMGVSKRDAHRAIALAVLCLPTEVRQESAVELGRWPGLAAWDLDQLVFGADALVHVWELDAPGRWSGAPSCAASCSAISSVSANGRRRRAVATCSTR